MSTFTQPVTSCQLSRLTCPLRIFTMRMGRSPDAPLFRLSGT